jgi:hypothetical protein
MADPFLTALLALWLLFAAIGLYGAIHFAFQHRYYARMAKTFWQPDPAPDIAVIMALKGAPPYAMHCLGAILNQDYPRYRVIVAVEDAADPACDLVAAARPAARPGVAIDLVIAGAADRRGQKVHNLLAAMAALRGDDRIVCFVDADTSWRPDTLATIARELIAWGEVLLLSGNRWIVPTGPGWAAAVTAAAGLPVAANGKTPAWDLAWGGTMALRRELLERLDLPRLWDRSISDDVPLSRALRHFGWVKTMPDVALPSPCDFSWAGALNFARRQYAMLRLYAPRHWLLAFATYAVFFAGLAAAAIALATPAAAPLRALALAAVALIPVRAVAHVAIAYRCLPRAAFRRLFRAFAIDALLPFIPALLHAYGIAASIRVRRLRWAGISYGLEGGRVSAVSRPRK